MPSLGLTASFLINVGRHGREAGTVGERRLGPFQHFHTWRLALRDALVSAGFDAPIRDTIRCHVWLKLWGNVCFNPISALTLATLDRITSEPGLRALCRGMMAEARAVAASLGVDIPEQMAALRLDAAGAAGGHKMSMLQDLERGRPLEIDAIVTALKELRRVAGVATPMLDMVLALIQERGRQARLYDHAADARSERRVNSGTEGA